MREPDRRLLVDLRRALLLAVGAIERRLSTPEPEPPTAADTPTTTT